MSCPAYCKAESNTDRANAVTMAIVHKLYISIYIQAQRAVKGGPVRHYQTTQLATLAPLILQTTDIELLMNEVERCHLERDTFDQAWFLRKTLAAAYQVATKANMVLLACDHINALVRGYMGPNELLRFGAVCTVIMDEHADMTLDQAREALGLDKEIVPSLPCLC